MAELGNRNWWRERRWGRGKAGRRLARTFHNAYHAQTISRQERTLWRWADRDGRLREAFISRLEMDMAIAGATAWCAGNVDDRRYRQAESLILRRLPEPWAKSAKRQALSLRAFGELCEGRGCHGQGDLGRLAQQLDRSPDAVGLDRLDFFTFAAALALDDDAWQEAMSGRDPETGEQVMEGEELERAAL